jgi:hypothetical protein
MRSLLVAGLLLCGCHKDKDCVPVQLTVRTSGVKVTVKHPNGATAELGTGPLTRASGACLGDIVHLSDAQRTYEESIQFGEPMEEKVIALK